MLLQNVSYIPCAVHYILMAYFIHNSLCLLIPNPYFFPPLFLSPLLITNLFSISKRLFLFYHIHLFILITYNACLSLYDIFHYAQHPPGLPMLLQMAQYHPFLWLSSIPLCIHTTSSSYIHLSVDI